jgi:hypothetical protein
VCRGRIAAPAALHLVCYARFDLKTESQVYHPDALDGRTFSGLLGAATAWLERNAAAINALNVFPVPDGDTGTNMLLTMRAAVEAAAKVPGLQAGNAGAVLHAAAQGAVMGARGNSGVILSQIIAGLAAGVGDAATCDGTLLARALAEGADTAYRAVPRPVEGTILTVARAAGEAAMEAAQREGAGVTCRHVFDAALAAARTAVEQTPEQLAILRQAGVVDAGGEGCRVILEGMALAERGEPLPEAPDTPEIQSEARTLNPAMHVPASSPSFGADLRAVPVEEWGYCTQFVIVGDGLDLGRARTDLQALAESALVVGDESLIRVHGHTEDPGQLLSYGAKLGRLQRISIEDMDAQHDTWLRTQVAEVQPQTEHGESERTPSEAPVANVAADVATVAVAPGQGLADVFRSLGVSQVVSGGQTMNPSAQDLLLAAKRTGAPTVIVLPNNGNVIMTARQAASIAAKEAHTEPRLRVVPTRTVPQGIAAQLAFVPDATAEESAAAMEAAAGTVRTVEITRATRAVTIDGITVKAGDALGLLDDKLVAAAADPLAAAMQALAQAGAEQAEVVTIYRGQGVAEAAAKAFVAALHNGFPSAEVELVDGGQPHYDYIISVE